MKILKPWEQAEPEIRATPGNEWFKRNGLENSVIEGLKPLYEHERTMQLTQQEINRKQKEEAFEKRRIEEKQVRNLRRNYRSQSLLGTGNTGEQDMSSQLGG